MMICNFIKKDTLAQVFYFEFCEICKNTFFAEYFLTTAFDYSSTNSTERKLAKNCKWQYTEIKAHRYKLEVGAMKRVNEAKEQV